MPLHHCRCFQEHLRMLLQRHRALCKAPGGAGSIWKYLEVLVRAAGEPGSFATGFRTKLHFADVLTTHKAILCNPTNIQRRKRHWRYQGRSSTLGTKEKDDVIIKRLRKRGLFESVKIMLTQLYQRAKSSGNWRREQDAESLSCFDIAKIYRKLPQRNS
jgi:hypothetical protein